MLAHAIDNPAPSTVVLISGDRDFAYALSILRLRRYHVVLITLSNAHPSLRAQTSLCFDWVSDILEPVDETLSQQLTPPRRGKASLPPHERLYSDSKSHNHSRYPFQESYDEKSASNVEFMDCFREETRRKENPRTSPKHETTHDLEQSQPAASTLALDTLRNGPEFPARVMHSPIATSYHTCIEIPLTVPDSDSDSSRATLIPNMSIGNMPPTFSPRTLRGSTSLPNLVQREVASVTTEPVSFDSSMQIPSADSPNLRGSLINVKAQSLSPPAHSDISLSPNLITLVSASVPSIIPPLPLSNDTVPAATPNPVKVAAPPPPTSFPTAPDKFKILIQCLKSHRSKGSLQPLRSKIALEVACNGTTYRQAGVLKFGQYVALAEKAGIVEMGGSESTAWIGLKAPWHNALLS
jgi:NYN domain